MSDQPDTPQPYMPPGYNSPPVPPYVQPAPPVQSGQPVPPYYAQPVAPAAQQPYSQPSQFNSPTYYQGGPGYPPPVGPKGMSLTSMIVGLASLFLVGFLIVPQIVGIILGHLGLKRESPQGRGFAIAGLVTNYLALVIWGIVVGIWVILVLVAAGSSASYSY